METPLPSSYGLFGHPSSTVSKKATRCSLGADRFFLQEPASASHLRENGGNDGTFPKCQREGVCPVLFLHLVGSTILIDVLSVSCAFNDTQEMPKTFFRRTCTPPHAVTTSSPR